MRKLKENLLKSLIYLSAFFTVSMLVVIVGYIFIKGIGGVNLSFLTSDYSADGSGGILPMIVTTVYTVILSIAIATPIGILSAIYLQEYAKKGKVVNAIRFATESLAGIPSIIYGLFGGIFFVVVLNLKYSILSGALTVAIIILPVIIRTTEEALKTVPDGSEAPHPASQMHRRSYPAVPYIQKRGRFHIPLPALQLHKPDWHNLSHKHFRHYPHKVFRSMLLIHQLTLLQNNPLQPALSPSGSTGQTSQSFENNRQRLH